MEAQIVYRLTGTPQRVKKAAGIEEEQPELLLREVDVSHIPLHELQRIFHAGPGNQLLERRYVNHEKALRLQSYISESLDTATYRWEFCGRWSDE